MGVGPASGPARSRGRACRDTAYQDPSGRRAGGRTRGTSRPGRRSLRSVLSLSRALSGQPGVTARLMAVALLKLPTGALRKLSDPPIPWLDRMSGDEAWKG